MSKKLKLNSVSEDFVHKKTSGSQNVKKSRNQDEQREQQTTYLTPQTRKLAKIHAAKTGETISELIERLLIKFFN
ncbi:MAG: hypothetical protein PF487_13940 [Bacteroidales bacterium]|jgi:hypothetical protein|nr:hypothetical protein [Bacteroidales bacterium]